MDVMFAFPRTTTARAGHVVDLDKVILRALPLFPPLARNLAQNRSSFICYHPATRTGQIITLVAGLSNWCETEFVNHRLADVGLFDSSEKIPAALRRAANTLPPGLMLSMSVTLSTCTCTGPPDNYSAQGYPPRTPASVITVLARETNSVRRESELGR